MLQIHENDNRITATHKSIFEEDNRHVKIIDERNLLYLKLSITNPLKDKGQLDLIIDHGIVISKF